MKLELGAGERQVRRDLGFLSCDCRDLPGIDYCFDMRGKFPFQNESIKEIYASNVMEHLTLPEFVSALTEIHRILKPGGKIRILVPDTERIVSKFYKKDIPCREFSRLMYGDQNYPENLHKICFDPEFLSEILRNLGFKNIIHLPGSDIAVEATK